MSLQVGLRYSFSTYSCNFGVFVGGSESRIFLLCHLVLVPGLKLINFVYNAWKLVGIG